MTEGLLKSKNKKEFIIEKMITKTEIINLKIFFLIEGEEIILVMFKSKSSLRNFDPL